MLLRRIPASCSLFAIQFIYRVYHSRFPGSFNAGSLQVRAQQSCAKDEVLKKWHR